MFIELKLKKVRVSNMNKLNEKNKRIFNGIMTYIDNSDLRNIEKEEVYHQMMDMLLEAQKEGREAYMLLGDDYEAFCKSVVDEYIGSRNMTYRILLYIQRYLMWSLGIILIMSLTNRFLYHQNYLGVNVSGLISVNIIVLTMLVIRRNNRRNVFENLHPKSNYKGDVGKDSFLKDFIIIMLSSFGLTFIVENFLGSNVFGKRIVLQENILYIVIGFVVIGVIEIYKRQMDKK